MIANIIIGYVVGRYLYEKAIPFIWVLIETFIEGGKWFNKKPSKFDDFYN